ncbi:MAG: class I SAM-dependent methyltransferase [Ruminiclostridium sp.]
MNTEKFTGKASAYEKYRPEYPNEFIEYLFSTIGLSKYSDISDIGSGTGILSRQLLEKGSRVFCVEPNDDMREIAEKNLSSYNNFISVNGSAEQTTLRTGSIDCITVAQAFHWFKVEKFKQECQRILKPNGKVVLVWNSRVAEAPLIIENAEICKKLCQSFKGFTGGQEEKSESFNMFFKAGIYEYKAFENNITYAKEGFLGRNLSASYAPKEGASNYEQFVFEINTLFMKYSNKGSLLLPNITRSYIGEV